MAVKFGWLSKEAALQFSVKRKGGSG
ncbi:hypothetical protein CCACVL1_01797 [Corchorus capsularis]|uniref:Uncharacterized protein n=1 Tax=Corchorus capsularis TaxID=210143 RepID=A0A1R3KFT4_COCAP|nr:hypothetical protein CCACVL1_06106 [Corchorus capsularis]OMP05894.1 hypothetical protein CCACVL1_01797 [Corchorus capsularis]